MKTISTNIPEPMLEGLEELVKRGLFANRSEAIRVAIRDLVKTELYDNPFSIPVPAKKKSTEESTSLTI